MHSSAAAMHWAARLKALPRVLHSVPDNKLSICNYLPPPDIRPPPEGGRARGPFFEERRILTNGARKVYNLHAAGFPCFGTGPVGGNAGKPVWKGSGHL